MISINMKTNVLSVGSSSECKYVNFDLIYHSLHLSNHRRSNNDILVIHNDPDTGENIICSDCTAL